MSSLWYYIIYLAAFGCGVLLLTIMNRHGASWAVKATIGILMSAVMAIGIFRVSEPPDLFADFYKAYYPAAQAVLAQDKGDGLAATMQEGAGGFVNLPILAYLFAPFGMFPPATAGYVFLILGVAGTLAAWWLLTKLVGMDRDRSLLLLFVFASCGPLHNSLREGNTTHFILLLLILGMWALRKKQNFVAGLVFGFAALIKLPLLLLGIYFALRGRWLVAMGGGIACAAAAALSLLVFGWDQHVFWYEHSIKPFTETPLAAFNVQSIQGFFARLQHGGSHLMDWTPHEVHPMIRLASKVTVAALMMSAGVIMFHPRHWRNSPLIKTPASTITELEVCIIVMLAMVISMVSWSHYYLWMLLPAAYLIAEKPRALARRTSRIVGWVAIIGALPPVLNIQTKNPLIHTIHSHLAVSHYLLAALLMLVVLLIADWMSSPVSDREEKLTNEPRS